jgi:hypothetical protein
MSSTRFAIGLALFLATTGWLLVRPGPPIAQAAQALETVSFDEFSEDEAAHRYVSSQPRHWRHLLIKK